MQKGRQIAEQRIARRFIVARYPRTTGDPDQLDVETETRHRRKHTDRRFDEARGALQVDVRAIEDGNPLLRECSLRGDQVRDEKRQAMNLRPMFPELPVKQSI